MNELIERARVKAGVMEMGERIAWGSDTALIRELADALEQQAKQIEELQRELDNERARDIHSCHDHCTRVGCVNRRLRAQIEELQAEVTEQARLNGMGSEREAAKDARIAELDTALRLVAQSHAWLLFGECRSFGSDVPLLVPKDADLLAHKALAIQPHADLVRKIKADAVRDCANALHRRTFSGAMYRNELMTYADRIEKGEVR